MMAKSTLIGRLLFDSKTILADTLNAIEKTSAKRGMTAVDLSLLTDGLQAEREQGITIDVAYRYFTTGTRKYIIADAPGHEQYTRNMVTAASTANLAIILVDARKGMLTQTRRHSYLASLVGIPHLLVAVNKMDLVDYDQAVFEKIKADYLAFAAKLDIRDVRFIPLSALNGDMVVERGTRLGWYEGPTLMQILEATPAAHTEKAEGFPVSGAVRVPPAGFRQSGPARLPRLHGPRRVGRDRRRRCGHRAALGPHQYRQVDRDRCGADRAGDPRTVGHHPAGRRDRHLARRHDRQERGATASRQTDRCDGMLALGDADVAGPHLSAAPHLA